MSEQLTYETWNEEKITQITEAGIDFFDIIKWAYEEYEEDEIVYACSFGAEGIVLIDLISKINPQAKIVFLDTSLHFKETYELIQKMKDKYPTLEIQLIKPKLSIEEQAKWYGDELWKTNPNLCCHLRKVAPLEEILQPVKAWISGLRREQSPLRSKTEYINRDEKFKKVKICPLIHWTWDDIWTYIHMNHLPYNPLHDKSYPSIGCDPCTIPVEMNEDSRAGRWRGQGKSECGLHQ